MEGLDVSKLPLDLLLNILNIVILFLITKTLVYKPVKKFMQERKERIENEKNEARQQLDEAQCIKEEYSSKLADTDNQAKQIILEKENEARKQASEIIEKAENDAEAIKQEAIKQAQKEKEAALSNMKNDVASLAVSISEKILSREVSDKDNERIIENFFKDGVNE